MTNDLKLTEYNDDDLLAFAELNRQLFIGDDADFGAMLERLDNSLVESDN